MLEAVQNSVLRLLKVPPQPDPPAGAPGSVRVFRAAPNFLYYHVFKWALKQVSTLFGILFGLYVVAQGWTEYIQFGPWSGERWFSILEALGIGFFLFQVPFTLAGVLLDFRMRWYIVTDRSLRIREGVGKVREKTMSFANIQNLGVRQGPIQRMLGISDLEVQTAGGGESKEKKGDKGEESLHVGYFRGVDNAEEIKGIVLERLRRLRDSGLGDPEERHVAEEPLALSTGQPSAVTTGGASASRPQAPGIAVDSDLLAASRRVLTEARELRTALTR